MNTYKVTAPNGAISMVVGETIRESETKQQWLIITTDGLGNNALAAIVPNNCLIEVITIKNPERVRP